MGGGSSTARLGGLLVFCLSLPFPVWADVIFLKSGQTIETSSWRDRGDAVEYDRYGGVIRIPKDEILRIDRAGAPLASPPPASSSGPTTASPAPPSTAAPPTVAPSVAPSTVRPSTSGPSILPGSDASARRLANEGRTLSKEEAEKLESELQRRPDDLPARTRLLGYYFFRSLRLSGPVVTLEARRRHILWLIQNRPNAEVGQLSEATLDPSGHVLADREGYEQAKAGWRRQIAARKADPAVLRNAVKFFTLPDKELAESTLKQLRAVDPGKTSSADFAHLYALGIMGINGLNQNGLPTSVNPEEPTAAFARKARKLLESSTDSGQLAAAGRLLSRYGAMIRGMRLTELDHTLLAESFLKRAQALAPSAQLDEDLKELYDYRRSLQGKGS